MKDLDGLKSDMEGSPLRMPWRWLGLFLGGAGSFLARLWHFIEKTGDGSLVIR